MGSLLKKTSSPIAVALLLGLANAAAGAHYYVAPNGDDSNPGTKAEPLATPEAARDAARKADGEPHRIVVMPGDYYLTKTLELDARDNGLTIEAAETGKATLYGGTPVTGWRRDGDKFWCADLPGVKEGTWDFRSLAVNGRLAERARLPESGFFEHRNTWSGARYISGNWDPKPTQEQLTTILYEPKDIPAGLDIRNAELRVYHMWNESLYGIASNDVQRQAFLLSSPTIHPPGAFGVKKYVIFNTREGMTRPGQWYLDRTAGRLVYWPLPDEDMEKARIIAPRLEQLIRAAGSKEARVTDLTIRGLTLQATTTPLGASGFGASGFGGAIHIRWSRGCLLEKLDVNNVGGQGIVGRSLTNGALQVLDCHVHHTGACGVEVSVSGSPSLVSRNHIHHVGLCYPSAICLCASGNGLHLYRNEIHDGPYSGIVCNGTDHRIEENLIYRVMREMHDGAAIYGHLKKSVLRGNLVRDVKMGGGFGAAAYYLDEQASDCIVERNVSIGVDRPIQNHIARDIVIRDNVFIADGDMQMTFNRSARCTFEGNTLFAAGDIDIRQPNAITSWKNNVVFRNGREKDGTPQPFTITDTMPPVPGPERRTHAAPVPRVDRPPTLDGEVGIDEWPGRGPSLDREPSRWRASGLGVGAQLCHDGQCLYVAVSAGVYQMDALREGAAWGKDDGAEIAIAGKTPDGKAVTFVIRGYPSGTCQSVTDAGAPAEATERLGKGVRFATKTWRRGWRGEWAIPFDALGLNPKPGLMVPFNLSVYRSEDDVWRCWEGTLAETWRLDRAGTMELK